MQNTDETKKRIIALLQTKGPCLPVQISRETRIQTLFISAFLSELRDENKIKISNLKVGGSPLYYLEGQEAKLENFKQYLHQKEIEALELLKKSKILRDSEQDPAIRVALRSIKDFAFSFKRDEEIYWRYLTTSEQEVKDILEPIKKKIEETEIRKPETKIPEPILPAKEEITKEEKPKEIKIQKEKPKEITKPAATPSSFNNPLALKPEPKKPEKIKPKSEFVEKVIEFLKNSKFSILEEKEYKSKEYNCISQLKTELGPIDFLTQAKDKKSISESDLDTLLRQAQSIPLPALFIYTGTLSKKAQEYENKYYSVLKTKKIAP